MSDLNSLAHCLGYIDCQLRTAKEPLKLGQTGQEYHPPAVTISRQTGAGGSSVANALAKFLQGHAKSPQNCPWAIFDKNLMEKVLEDHHLPKRLAQYLPEDKSSMISDMMEEILGLHPEAWTVLHQTTETILHLAEMGNVIIVGRGAHLITSRMEHVFHVRLVAPFETRVRRIMESEEMTKHEAVAYIQKKDEGRERFLKKHFKADINDPLLYHLTLNTGLMPYDRAAEIIGREILARQAER